MPLTKQHAHAQAALVRRSAADDCAVLIPLFSALCVFTHAPNRTNTHTHTHTCVQAALVYAEVLLIAQYSYLCLVRCVCEAPSSLNPEGEMSPGVWNEVGLASFTNCYTQG